MSKEENSDLKEIKECLIGTEFDRKKGLVYKVDCLITTSNKHDNNQLIMQNQINAIQEQMNKKRSFGGAIKTFFFIICKMRATLTRTLKNEVETLGQLDVADFKCYTLERPDNGNQKRTGCIPTGIYPVTRHNSEKLGKTFWIHNVPNRDAILIHKGNFYFNSLGCILVGMEQKDTNKDGQLDNVSSTIAMNKLLEYDITEIEIIEI